MRRCSDTFTLTDRESVTHFFGAMQIAGFIDKDEFKKQIDEWIRVIKPVLDNLLEISEKTGYCLRSAGQHDS